MRQDGGNAEMVSTVLAHLFVLPWSEAKETLGGRAAEDQHAMLSLFRVPVLQKPVRARKRGSLEGDAQ